MDSRSASALARELGTSVPRVVRAAQRLGLDSRTGAGTLTLTPAQARRVRDALGVAAPAPGLTAPEATVLAALARAPLGLPSARAVASKAGVSPTTAARAVANLLSDGLVQRRDETVPGVRPRRVGMLYANRTHPAYPDLAPALRRIRPPRRAPETRVPGRLTHLFWNTSPNQLRVATGGRYIAQRLLRTLDPEGLAWGAQNLRAGDWAAAASARGLDDATRALAHNLASATN